MPYEIQLLPDQRSLHITYRNPFDVANDTVEIARLLKQHFAWIEDDCVYVLHDVREFASSFNQLVQWLAAAFQPANPDHAFDPRARSIAIGSQALLQVAASSLRQTPYNGVRLQVFGSLDEALAAIRQDANAPKPH